MEKYLSIRVQTALYISIFFVSIHHVFVFMANSSNLRYIFELTTLQILFVYGLAAIFGVLVYFTLLKNSLTNNIKQNIYIATVLEIISLGLMYYFTININAQMFIGLFILHHLLTPYIMFNLDALFETYTHISERGKSRGIYLTVWNIPFVLVPLIMSTLTINRLSIVYMISSLLLLPFLYLIFYNIKNPIVINNNKQNLKQMLLNFFNDNLDRKAFTTQFFLHLYYGATAIMLPLYLYTTFNFEWNKIGLILAAMTAPFVLIQIPFGNMEDKYHNEKTLFKIGIALTVLFSVLVLMISPKMDANISFLLLSLFLFLSHVGCSLIEISTEGMFYKHVTARDHTALLMFRMARILPYSLGILALFWII
jgi:hypothetical protein